MKEIWKDIPGFEGKYQASNLGKIKSLKRVKLFNNKIPNRFRSVNERLLKYWTDKDGYYQCRLYKNKKSFTFAIHSLIWITFSGIEYDKKKCNIDHIDNIKSNNSFVNLQILTSGQNIGKGYQFKGKKLPIGITLKNNRFVARFQLNKKSNYIGSFITLSIAEEEYKKFMVKL